jgi:hypothetical protein
MPRPYARWQKVVLLLGINVLSIGVLLFTAEKALRIYGFTPYLRTFPGQHADKANTPKWLQRDPILGWVGNKTNPEINPQGFRDRKDFNRIDLHSVKLRVMILGDSFIYGANRASENLPSQLQSKLQERYEVFNLGVPGWGIDQMYLAYEQYKDIIRPNVVILAFIDVDVRRVLEAYRVWEGLNKPSFAVEKGDLVPRGPISESQILLKKLMSRSIIFSFIMQQIYLMKDARAIVEHIFLRMIKETQQRNEEFVLVRIPITKSLNYIDSVQIPMNYAALFMDTDVIYLDPSEEMRELQNWATHLYLPGGHMSVAGDQFLTNYIYRRVFENRTR